MTNKIKIVNDPVHGFIQMPIGIGLEIVNHSWFQRLRNIKQLGMAHYVYPGAMHTRFQHSLGAFFLTHEAIKVLRTKGIDITDSEAEGVLLAILMHDIGHGPFSHTLEKLLIRDISHEQITHAFMNHLNLYTEGGLNKAIDIIKNIYIKKFLHQLISSQLDMDRLDYLKRDSFFTGVSEGVIGTERIIKMLTVSNDSLAIEEKGIYSIEKFLIARRLMYWQVYLHKTVLAAELMLQSIFKRVHFLYLKNKIQLPIPLSEFWSHKITIQELNTDVRWLNLFSSLDDADIWTWIKSWTIAEDKVLSLLSNRFIERKLFKVEIQRQPHNNEKINLYRKRIQHVFNLSEEEAEYLVFSDSAENHAYSITDNKINILFKNGKLIDISDASDILNIEVLSKNVIKYFLCFLPECTL